MPILYVACKNAERGLRKMNVKDKVMAVFSTTDKEMR
jgi:hypothetical protein